MTHFHHDTDTRYRDFPLLHLHRSCKSTLKHSRQAPPSCRTMAAAKAVAGTASRAMALHKLSLDAVPLSGQRVLMRVDFNVPQDKKVRRVEAAELRGMARSTQAHCGVFADRRDHQHPAH